LEGGQGGPQGRDRTTLHLASGARAACPCPPGGSCLSSFITHEEITPCKKAACSEGECTPTCTLASGARLRPNAVSSQMEPEGLHWSPSGEAMDISSPRDSCIGGVGGQREKR
jgi:hypothetical protein